MTTPLRVLMLHSRYAGAGGGENVSVTVEADSLRRAGHTVHLQEVPNDDWAGQRRSAVLAQAVWNQAALDSLAARLGEHDLLHVQNTFPALSAAVLSHRVTRAIPTVLSVRNYRSVCVAATLFRDGRPCTDCLHSRVGLPGLVHRCYRGATAPTAVATLARNSYLATGAFRRPARVIAVSEAQRRLLVASGRFRPERLVVKPNTLDSVPAVGPGDGGFLLFVGRLEPEKGILQLVQAWRESRTPLRLVMVGEGSLGGSAALRPDERLDVRPAVPHGDVLELMGRAAAVVVPSLWDEPFGRVAVESLACGTPVICTARGGLPEIVENGTTGFVLEPSSLTGSLAQLLSDAATVARLRDMRAASAELFRARFSPEATTGRLVRVYREAMDQHLARRGG